MVPVAGSEQTIPADLVLISAGFIGTEDHVARAFNVTLNPRGNVKSNQDYQTNIKKLFVAGDMRAVDFDLMGYSNL